MMSRAFGLFTTVFRQCALWTNQLLNAVGAKGVVISAFTLVLIISVLFIPLRGGSLLIDRDSFMDFVTYKPKHSKGIKKLFGGRNGKFSERHYKFNGKRK